MQSFLFLLLPILTLSFAAPANSQTVSLSEPFEKEGNLVVTLTNTGAKAISAYLVETKVQGGGRPRARISKYMDALVNAASDKPLLPNETVTISLGDPKFFSPQETNIAFSGAILQDGTAIGTDEGKAILVGRRRELFSELQAIMELLSQSAGSPVPAKASLLESAQLRASRTKEKGQQLSAAEIPILAARTMATDWITGNLQLIPDSCSGACLEKRLNFLRGLLSTWRDKLRQDTINIQD